MEYSGVRLWSPHYAYNARKKNRQHQHQHAVIKAKCPYRN